MDRAKNPKDRSSSLEEPGIMAVIVVAVVASVVIAAGWKLTGLVNSRRLGERPK